MSQSTSSATLPFVVWYYGHGGIRYFARIETNRPATNAWYTKPVFIAIKDIDRNKSLSELREIYADTERS